MDRSQELSPTNTAVTSGQTHTPGPWSLYVGEDLEAISVTKHVTGNGGGATGKSVCRMPLPNLRPVHTNAYLDQSEINANARLIAAAPDLLEALRDVLGIIHSVCPEYVEATMCANARAAIAKAEGK